MNEYTLADIAVGFSQSFTKEITTQMEDAFRCITGDENPLHKDDTYAASISNGKFPQHVSFGMLTASLYSTLAGMYIPGKYSLIHSFEHIKFLQPVFAGDTLTVTGTVTDKDESLNLLQVKVSITNQDKQCVSKAKLKVLVLK